MSFVEAFIRALIWICLVALLAVLCLWVLSAIGVHLPAMAINILYVIFGLVVILILFRLFAPWISGWLTPPP